MEDKLKSHPLEDALRRKNVKIQGELKTKDIRFAETVERYEKDGKEYQEQKSELNRTLLDKCRKIDKLQSDLKDSKEKIERLKREYKEEELRKNCSYEYIEKLQSEISDYKTEVSDTNKAWKDTSKELADVQAEIRDKASRFQRDIGSIFLSSGLCDKRDPVIDKFYLGVLEIINKIAV